MLADAVARVRTGLRSSSGRQISAGEEDAMVGVLKKALLWLLIAFLIYYVVTKPQASATAISGAVDGIRQLFSSLGEFFAALTR